MPNTRYALVKDGAILYICDVVPVKQEYDDEDPEKVKVPGLDYDEAVPFDFEGNPVLENGKIVPDPEPAKIRKAEILAILGKLSDTRKGLESLGEPTGEVDANIETLKAEYATLN